MTETKWLTVDEAAHLSQEMGLNRTKKTIRDWARKGHVAARKQTTSHGSMWVLDKSELISKIEAELEFAAQERTRADAFEPVRTGANPSEPVRTRAHMAEQVREEPENVSRASDDGASKDEIHSLKTQIQALSVDVGWRDKMLEKLTRENERMLENMHGQARYIGHMESDLLRLGGELNQQFLAAPKVQQDESADISSSGSLPDPQIINPDRPHPDQQSFTSG